MSDTQTVRHANAEEQNYADTSESDARSQSLQTTDASRDGKKAVKCVVWDLDNTLWHGVLLEDERVALRERIVDIIETLDSRGILQSVASKNDHARAMELLREFGLHEYFLYPQINWNSKASSIKLIAEALNIGLDAMAFIDDQPFERAEVNFSLPEVLCLDSADLSQLLERPDMNPRFLTEDSRKRRQMYLSDIERKKIEEEFVGPKEEFLATLEMVLNIAPAREEDLQRAEELTVRTNQLNSTGYTYSYEELDAFRRSEAHTLLIVSLDDKFGSYGKIGLALVERGADVWTIKLLLMSCRVMSKGVGTIMLGHIMRAARRAGVRLRADFVSNNRNRMMYITYKFAGFKELEKRGDLAVLENDLAKIPAFPDYVKIEIEDEAWTT
jgi:FkbH-like protein